MTRFQASGPRITYKPKQGTKPFEQMVGLYGMWMALPPEARKKIASLFSSDNGEMGIADDELDPNLDTSLVYQEIPEFGSENGRKAQIEEIVGGPVDWNAVSVEIPDKESKLPDWAQDIYQMPIATEGPGTDVSTEPTKTRQRKIQTPEISWSAITTVNPADFKAPNDTIADLPTGHYAFDPKTWRGL